MSTFDKLSDQAQNTIRERERRFLAHKNSRSYFNPEHVLEDRYES